MDITIIGTGYVGLVAATCFASAGHQIHCVDSNPDKLTQLKKGEVPFFEPGLEDLFKQNKTGMSFYSAISDAISKSKIVFIAVGTPELPDGSADMEPTLRVLEEICNTATGPLSVVLKSTVPIGTASKALQFCKNHCAYQIEIISNPEFLRQGAAVTDFLNPDRVVIGCQSEEARQLMSELYRPFLETSQGQVFFMDNTSAEMVKYAANSFLALKISFINELALLADKLGADINSVREGFTSDHRINPAFFSPGIGYGGSCFPKDVRALVHTGKQLGLDLMLLQATDQVNERQKSILTERLYSRFGSISGLKIAVWGLAFKPDTDDVRRAPSIKIIEELTRLGAQVVAYDPVAMKNATANCMARFLTAESPLAAATGADALLILTEWKQFKSVDLDLLKKTLKQPVIFDGRNIFDPEKLSKKGIEYFCIGRSAKGQSLTATKRVNPLSFTATL